MGVAESAQRIVVVGASLAGVTLVDSLRRQGFSGSIALIGAEAQAAYNRPALSKGVIGGSVEDADILLPPLTCEVDEIIGTGAASLDLDRGRVLLDDGEYLPFDKIAITTGARARRLADVGAADPGVRETTLRDLEDARRLSLSLRDRPRVVIVGAGILGMEMASACVNRGAAVVVVDQQPPLLSRLGGYLADLIVNAATAHGVTVVHHPAGVRLRGSGTPVVELVGGRQLEGDLVLTAAGCVPNIDWLETTGLLVEGNLRVNSRCQITPNVVAAGDVAAFPTQAGHRRTPLWNSALEQARTAARALLDGEEAPILQPSPYFWTEQFGLTIRASGELPVRGIPTVLEGDSPTDGMLLCWPDYGYGSTAVAINKRIPIPRLRALTRPAQMEVSQ
jgi:NADPH-dependent 2,4-dienoyl-CoA reductase/sulfur reductase-like enzyme